MDDNVNSKQDNIHGDFVHMDICGDCNKDYEEAMREDFEEEQKTLFEKEYKETCEEATGTEVLNEEEIFGKLSAEVGKIISDFEGYINENYMSLRIDGKNFTKDQNSDYLFLLSDGKNKIEIGYSYDGIDESPSATNSVLLKLILNEIVESECWVEHVNGEIEFLDGIPSPLSQEGINHYDVDDFISKVIDIIDTKFEYLRKID